MTTRWTIGIDWDRDGSYTDETARVLSAKWMLGFQQAYMDVGNDAKLTLLLRNDDRRFTPEKSAGPLSGKLADAWTCVAGKLKQFKIRERIVALDKNSCALMHSS